MLTLSQNNKTYANYSLENFEKFMFTLIKKALKNKNLKLTIKDYKKAVNKSNPDHYKNNSVLTFDKHLDVFLINVPSVDNTSIDVAFVKADYKGDIELDSTDEDYCGNPVIKLTDKDFNKLKAEFTSKICDHIVSENIKHAIIVTYQDIQIFNFENWEYQNRMPHISFATEN
mgnify:FL=1